MSRQWQSGSQSIWLIQQGKGLLKRHTTQLRRGKNTPPVGQTISLRQLDLGTVETCGNLEESQAFTAPVRSLHRASKHKGGALH